MNKFISYAYDNFLKHKLCELFGLSSNIKVSATELLKEFLNRGNKHPHGWGISWHLEGGLAGLVKEPISAPESKIARIFAENIESELIIAHIRKMSKGSYLSYNNTHPFVKTFRKKDLIFAHNGDIPEIKSNKKYRLKNCKPLGETDSEHAFCFILERLQNIRGNNLGLLARRVWKLAENIGNLGKFNFLLSDGNYLLAYMNREGTLHYLFNPKMITPKGKDNGFVQNLRVVVIATEKLTDEDWVMMKPGILYVFNKGSLIKIFEE
ncbi:MAG: class II glutamine amidotransferase [Nitrososphaeria archaeon]|nr:class II glutamine amidotransferase [Conexivisphaerales archaeon]